MSDTSYGQMWPSNAAGEFNKIAFLVDQMMSRLRTTVPVKIIKVLAQDGKTTATQGSVAGAGFVQVQPMVSMIDGAGNSTPHGIVYNIPYTRAYGGSNAVLLDPVVGDIGFMVVADRDISSFKSQVASNQTQGGNAASNPSMSGSGAITPASDRRFDFADGIYIGGILNRAPSQYVTFTSTGVQTADKNGNIVTLDNSSAHGGGAAATNTGVHGITLVDMSGNKIEMRHNDSSSINGVKLTDLTGNIIEMKNDSTIATTTSNLHNSGDVTAGYGTGDLISLQNHTHGVPGGGNTTIPNPGIGGGVGSPIVIGNLTVTGTVTATSFVGGTGGGTIIRTQRSVTATPITVGVNDQILNCNIASPATCTLPSYSTRNGLPITFADLGQAGTNNITITPNGSETIDGVNAARIININWAAITLVPFNDGVNSGWKVE